MAGSPGEVTLLLAEINLGHKDALSRLIPLVYRELRRTAGRYLRDERIGHTLQPTALVHEVFLRLSGQDRATWQNRVQFMTVAAQLMRRILVDYARRRTAGKRSGLAVALDDPRAGLACGPQHPEEILAVDEALARLHERDPRLARIVEFRYFGGLSVEEAAVALGLSSRTVKREWAIAKAFLRAELAERMPS